MPQVREGVLTQVRKNGSVVVVDPQNKRSFVIDGPVADLWLMMEQEKPSAKIKTAVLKGLDVDEKEQRTREVSDFFDTLVSYKLVRR